MKIIKDHFEGNTTYIHNDMVLHGCLLFNIKDLNKVCNNNGIPDTVKQEVMDLYKSKEELSLDEVLKLDHRKIAKLDYKELLDILVTAEDWYIRVLVAKHDYKDLLDILVKDRDEFVRAEVAKHNYKDLLDILINDESIHVRFEVDKHLI